MKDREFICTRRKSNRPRKAGGNQAGGVSATDRVVGQAMGRQRAVGRRWSGNRRAGDGSATDRQLDRRWVGNRQVVGQAMGRQQAGSRTGDGSATGE